MRQKLITCPVTAHLAELAMDTDSAGRVVLIASCSEQDDGGCDYVCAERLNRRVERARAAVAASVLCGCCVAGVARRARLRYG